MRRKTSDRGITRRNLLKAGAVGIAAPIIVPSTVFGADAPSNRITVASIGIGGMGGGHLGGLIGGANGAQLVGICDADATRLAKARERSGLPAEAATLDFRDIIARDDIDAVVVATPDHWHALISIAAMESGKDVYCEKPQTLTIAEGRAISDTAKRLGRVFQTGSQQRSDERFRFGCELVRNGRIGELKEVHVGLAKNNRKDPGPFKPEEPPVGFDYNMWLGPAPWAPYTPMRCHYTFRFILDYSGGQTTNWGAHHLDIAQWGVGMDDAGPVEFLGRGEYPSDTSLFTTPTKIDFDATYSNGVKLFCANFDKRTGTTFVGTEGTVYVNRGKIETTPSSLLTTKIGPNEINLYRSANHKANFFDCIRTRRDPICCAEVGHRSASLCHLGNISMMLKRPLKWDPAKEQFEGDEDANNMVTRGMRAPWRL